MVVSIVLTILFLLLILLSSIISVTVLLFIFVRLRPSLANVSLLLICNTYVTIILFCFTLLDIGIHSLYGHLNPSVSFAGRWCEVRAYFPHVSFCAYYYSFVCQAIFRLFRIVLYKKKRLQSFGVFVLAILIQWLLSFIFIAPHLIFDDFQYQPLDYNCWISFQNIRGMLVATLIIYGGPLAIILSIYVYIIRYVRRRMHSHRKQKRSIQRDVIILRRIVVLLIFLIMIGVPTLVVLVIYLLTDYLTPLAYDIQAVNISIGLLTTTLTLLCVTPKIRHLFRRRRRTDKSLPLRSNQVVFNWLEEKHQTIRAVMLVQVLFFALSSLNSWLIFSQRMFDADWAKHHLGGWAKKDKPERTRLEIDQAKKQWVR